MWLGILVIISGFILSGIAYKLLQRKTLKTVTKEDFNKGKLLKWLRKGKLYIAIGMALVFTLFFGFTSLLWIFPTQFFDKIYIELILGLTLFSPMLMLRIINSHEMRMAIADFKLHLVQSGLFDMKTVNQLTAKYALDNEEEVEKMCFEIFDKAVERRASLLLASINVEMRKELEELKRQQQILMEKISNNSDKEEEKVEKKILTTVSPLPKIFGRKNVVEEEIVDEDLIEW